MDIYKILRIKLTQNEINYLNERILISFNQKMHFQTKLTFIGNV